MENHYQASKRIIPDVQTVIASVGNNGNIPIWGCTTQQKEAAHSILAPAMTLSMAIPTKPSNWKALESCPSIVCDDCSPFQ